MVVVDCEDKAEADFVDMWCLYYYGCVDFDRENADMCMEACRKEVCGATPRKPRKRRSKQ